MGFHEKDDSERCNSLPVAKKPKFGIRKLAKKLLKKTRKNKSDDNESLLESDAPCSKSQTSGRSIEVLSDEEGNQECSCCTSQDEHSADRAYCNVCGGTYRCTSKRQRRVRFSGEVVIAASGSQKCGKNSVTSENQRKHKKHKKLQKARKLTWKVMKTTWKYLKTGIQVMAASPAMHMGSVISTVNNPAI